MYVKEEGWNNQETEEKNYINLNVHPFPYDLHNKDDVWENPKTLQWLHLHWQIAPLD